MRDLFFSEYALVVPFRKVLYQELSSGDTVCVVPQETYSSWENNINVNIDIDPPNNCPPADTTLKNTFKITKTRIITMIGNGLECGLRNTIWLGTEGRGTGNPLGIVKDQLEIRWGEAYWEAYGSDWNLISRIELSSLLQTESESSSLLRIFQPIQHLSLNKLGNEANFDNEPYVVNSSYGIQRLVPPNEK